MCLSFVERNHDSEIGDTGRKYETVQAVQCLGRELIVFLITPSDNTNPVEYFLASVNDHIEHA